MLRIILLVIYIINCIVLSAAVLVQEGKGHGLGILSGGNSTFWQENKNRSAEYLPVRITRVTATIFFVLSVVLSVIP